MFYCYILECNNGSLYTGYTTDLDRRFAEHKTMSNKSAKYVKSHGKGAKQFRIAFELDTKESAMSLEYWIKKLSKKEKLKLIDVGLEHPIFDMDKKFKGKVLKEVNYNINSL